MNKENDRQREALDPKQFKSQFKPQFKPMTEGLGLNHFEEGLPYTPMQSRRRPMVHFNFPPPRQPRTSQQPTPSQTVATELEAEPSLEDDLRGASFIRRCFAFAIDLVLSSGIFALIVWAGFSLNGYNLRELVAQGHGMSIFWPLVLLYVVMHMGYFLVQETTWRRTIGKAAMGIRIQCSSGVAILGRALCFFVAALPFGIGLFWYFFDSKRRCWHDVITDCEVVTG